MTVGNESKFSLDYHSKLTMLLEQRSGVNVVKTVQFVNLSSLSRSARLVVVGVGKVRTGPNARPMLLNIFVVQSCS